MRDNFPPLFPADHVRLTPIPDALASFHGASPAEQMRRVRVVLEDVRSMYRRRFSTLWATLEFVARAGGNSSPATAEAARRALRAIAGTYDLRDWEQHAGRTAVAEALDAAVRHCSPTKRQWLEALR